MNLGSGSWFAPRFGLAPTPAETEAGARYVRVYPLGWWYDGNFHRWTVRSEANCDCDLHCFPASLSPLSVASTERFVFNSKVIAAFSSC